MDKKILLEKAIEASKNSHSPYSNFCVGATLLTKDNKIYTGCNIENHGIQSICAERVAFTKALSEGEKIKNFESILIIGHNKNEGNYTETLPCGYCRQFISEFVDQNFKVYTYNNNKIKEYNFKDLLPYSFDFNK